LLELMVQVQDSVVHLGKQFFDQHCPPPCKRVLGIMYTTMVVNTRLEDPPRLDLGYLALFLGMRVSQLVMQRMHASGFQNIRESHGYVIQHLIEKERSITELAQRMEVSQQAASKVVSELAELGVLDVVAGPDRRAKRVRLSLRGWS